MDASPRRIVELLTSAGTRFVVPVFQRPYSWDEENCKQLWEDILSAGRGQGAPHFTGSVVWIQHGTMSAAGVTPLLLIDGQQRITTITLLLIALARYSQSHPEVNLAFSYREILGRGYLLDEYKTGDDHYRLTLSQGDIATLRSIEDHLQNPDIPIVHDSKRLIENLEFFERLVAGIEDPAVVWAGLQRLEVVSISLEQGQDNPQLIFESMNSTGKDLSFADLIRNFVLMGHPQQDELYRTYWRPIETTLGAASYEEIFDDFVRDWLAVVYAPDVLVKRDMYQAFKRHLEIRRGDDDDAVKNMLREFNQFAGHYAEIRLGHSEDPEIGRWMDRIRRLDISVVNPLLMVLLDDYGRHTFGRDELLAMLKMLESYLFRRAVCDCATNSLQKFFWSMIGRLRRIRTEEHIEYVDAFTAYLLNEAGTLRRFPTDAEFVDNLHSRDAYHFRRCLYLLSRLENSYHPKDERDFELGMYTIEHIMPQNALKHEEWRVMSGDVDEETFEHLLHNLGNLTLTAYNSELSDGTFAQKQQRAIGGYSNEYVSLSSELRSATQWTPQDIDARCRRLAARALEVWPLPEMDSEARKLFLSKKKESSKRKEITFRDLFSAGLIGAGDILTSTYSQETGSAVVTESGAIRLANGEEFSSPSPAAARLLALQGLSLPTVNGWSDLRKGNDGPRLNDLRRELDGGLIVSRLERLRSNYWEQYYALCADSPAFVSAFGDPMSRSQNTKSWAVFAIGVGFCHFDNHLGLRDHNVDSDVYFPAGERYDVLYAHKDSVEKRLSDSGAAFLWSDPDSDIKSRALWLRIPFDYLQQDWRDAQLWMRETLPKVRTVVLEICM